MRAKRSLGQNFLTDAAVIGRIVRGLDLTATDTVVEIGPGRGALTRELVKTGARVVAIEVDPELIPLLRRELAAENLTIVEADILEADLSRIVDEAPGTIKLVGNLPYYISTAILQKLAAERHRFSQIIVMLQREVVERIMAKPGTSSRGYLTVMVEAAFDATALFDVPPSSFEPRPKIWSSVVRLTPKPPGVGDTEIFRRLVSAAFGQKRKTILNNLKLHTDGARETLEKASIDPGRRAETLSLSEWYALSEAASGSLGDHVA